MNKTKSMRKITIVAITLLAFVSCNNQVKNKSKHEVTLDSLNKVGDSLRIIVNHEKSINQKKDSANSEKRIKAANNPNFRIVEYKGKFVIMDATKKKFLIKWTETKDYSFESFVGNLILDSKEECIEHILEAEYYIEREKYKKQLEKNFK